MPRSGITSGSVRSGWPRSWPEVRGPARDLHGRPDRDLPCVHWRCGPVPSALRVPAEADSAGNESRYRCSDRGIREERAGQESFLDPVHLDGRARPGTGPGPGDSQQIVGMITGMGI